MSSPPAAGLPPGMGLAVDQRIHGVLAVTDPKPGCAGPGRAGLRGSAGYEYRAAAPGGTTRPRNFVILPRSASSGSGVAPAGSGIE